jgi:hypothetical protein
MKPELRSITRLTVASTAALLLLAAPFAIDWRTLDIDSVRAVAKGDDGDKGGAKGGGKKGGKGGAVGAVGSAVGGAVGAVGDAVGAVGDAAGAVADGVSGAVGGGDGEDSGSASDGDGSASADAADGGAPADASDGGAPADASDGGAPADAADGAESAEGGDAPAADSDSAPADAAASSGGGSGPEPESAPDASEAATPPAAAETASPPASAETGVVDAVVDAVAGATPVAGTDPSVASSTEDSIAAPSGPAGKARVARTGLTVAVKTIRLRPTHDDGGDKRRLVGSPSKSAPTMAELPADDAAARVAAIEPSAGAAFSPTGSAFAGCAASDGRSQGTEISCLVAGSESQPRTQQVAYAPPDATIDGRDPEAAAAPKLAPAAGKLPEGPSVYDELYGLQQVEARRYADGGMPVLIVQGIVSNMSVGQRSVPPLLAIVQDDQGKELMRWTFRAEAETLDPGGSTGFRSEMFDAGSESARVTIVFAAEQQTMR